jgi:hypothetical protein
MPEVGRGFDVNQSIAICATFPPDEIKPRSGRASRERVDTLVPVT